MAFVLAVLGGAAAIEISKLLHKNGKVSAKDLEVLQSKQEELQEVLQDVQAELQQEKDAHQVDTQRVLELSAFAEQLQTTKADLERQSAALMSDKRQLTSDNEQLTEDKEQLLQRTELLLQQQAESHRTTDSLRIENTSLAQQVATFKQAKEASVEVVEQLAARIETLKASVSSLLGRFATKEINSTELLQRLRGLGLEVNVTPESLDALPDVTDHPGLRNTQHMVEQMNSDFNADFSKQLRLISDSPDRLSQLLATVSAAPEEDNKPSSSSRYRHCLSACIADRLSATPVPEIAFPTLKSPPKERQGGQMFSFLQAVGLTPRKDESGPSKVPALNLSSVGYKSPAKSPRKAMQPTEVNSSTGPALVFRTPKKEGRKGSKYTVNLAPAAAERTTPRKSSTPKRMRSSAAALEFGDRENADPFRGSRDLIPR